MGVNLEREKITFNVEEEIRVLSNRWRRGKKKKMEGKERGAKLFKKIYLDRKRTVLKNKKLCLIKIILKDLLRYDY